jgi:hypothetical protein
MSKTHGSFRHNRVSIAVLGFLALLAAGCTTTRSAVFPDDPANTIERSHISMRLHAVDRSPDAMLMWIDIANNTGETVVIFRSQQTMPTFSQLYSQIRLLGAGEPVTAKRQSHVRTVDKAHYRILSGEHARLAVGFVAPGIDRAKGLTVEVRAWQDTTSDVWSIPIPNENSETTKMGG